MDSYMAEKLELAKTGSIEAIMDYADRLNYGYLEFDDVTREAVQKKDVDQAILWYEKAADKGSTKAMDCLGDIFKKREDYSRAIHYYEQGRKLGDGECTNDLAFMYKHGDGVTRDISRMLDLLIEAGDMGYAESYWYLGMAYKDSDFVGLDVDYKKAAHYYSLGYQLGSINCCESLAPFYINGQGVEANPQKGFELCLYAANNDSIIAMKEVGACYASGIGIEKNFDEAIRYAKMAIEHGLEDAKGLLLGVYMMMCSEEMNEQAFENIVELADGGDGDAHYCLFALYQDGICVSKDADKAEQHLYKAVECGVSEFAGQFGVLLCQRKVYTVGIPYLEKACEADDAKAMVYLGDLLKKGDEGVEADEKRAFELFLKAERKGNARACFKLGNCYSDGIGVEQSTQEGMKWFRKGAEQGDCDSQTILAYSYLNGEGIEKDPSQALYWFEKAAEQGDVEAQCVAGELYFDGEGTQKDERKAEEFFLEVLSTETEGGFYNSAALRLGWIYQDFYHDDNSAFVYFKMAADAGVPIAKYNLGVYYYFGRGTTVDKHKALYWFRQAQGEGVENAENNVRVLTAELGLGNSGSGYQEPQPEESKKRGFFAKLAKRFKE